MNRGIRKPPNKASAGKFFHQLRGCAVLLHQGKVYVPCPTDPQIASELQAQKAFTGMIGHNRDRFENPRIFFHDAIPFVEAFSWEDLVRNAQTLLPGMADEYRKRSRRDLWRVARLHGKTLASGFADVVLFQVLPRFVRLPQEVKSAENRAVFLAVWLAHKVHVPQRFFSWAEQILREDPARPERPATTIAASGSREGNGPELISGCELEDRLRKLLEKACRDAMGNFLDGLRHKLKGYRDWPMEALGFMLYIWTRGALEVDGFGFFHRASDGALVVYKRTGQYALRDYYHRLYVFPDCRVAVNSLDLWPVVIEEYKHPLLARHQPWQRICLGHSPVGRSFTSTEIIRTLEDGLNALYYGYDPRKRNGYHSLDRFSGFHTDIHFEDLRISADDPRIRSGKIQVTNAFS